VAILKGEIVRRVPTRGFGFIRQENSKREFFYHMSQCASGPSGYEAMVEGTKVLFEEGSGDKGPRAINVTPDVSGMAST
jgi:CspA family cold shock protein